LLAIINDILDLSKIEAGKMLIEHIDFNLTEIIDGAIHSLSFRAKEKGLKLSIKISPDVPKHLKGDPVRIRQVLFNLVGNAIKFTQEGSCKILVDLFEKQTSYIRFSISDTGVGITNQTLNHIFESFSQAETSTTRKFGGTGLGLTICKRLVELMKGSIWVESELGVGSTFYFTIPFEQGEKALKKKQEHYNVLPINTSLSILLAEDNLINQKVIIYYFKPRNHRIVAVNNGREAVDKLRAEKLDVILMDIQMPEVDGVTATRLIRSDSSGSFDIDIPIIALTAHALKGDKDKFLQAGMNEYLTKPVNFKKLEHILAKWFTDPA